MFRIQEEFKVSRGSRFKVKRGFRVVSDGFRVVSGGWKKKSSRFIKSSRFEEVQGWKRLKVQVILIPCFSISEINPA